MANNNNPFGPVVELSEKYINWNWMGLAAGVLTVLVTIRNIQKYYEAIQYEKQG